MKLTNDEMYFLNRISGGGVLFGIHLRKPKSSEEQTALLMQSLKDKGLIEPGGVPGPDKLPEPKEQSGITEKLSMQGAGYVHAIRKYREAERHTVCNRIYAAQISGEEAVVIMVIPGGYDVYRVPIVLLACLLVQQCPCIRGERADAAEEGITAAKESSTAAEEISTGAEESSTGAGTVSGHKDGQRVEICDIMEELGRAEHSLTLGCFVDFKGVQECVYYALSGKLYRYDFHKGRKRQVRGKEVRREVAEVILKEWRGTHGRTDQCRG